MKYSMRIGKRVEKRHRFDYDSIDNIPFIDIFIEESDNRILTQACKRVLYNSMQSERYRYGEQGILVSIGNNLPKVYETFTGNYREIKVDDRYRNIVKERDYKDLVFIHNHPSNSYFSAEDLITFALGKSLIALIAVGNQHNVYILIDTGSKIKMLKYINYYRRTYKSKYANSMLSDKEINNKAVPDILNNPEKFGVYFEKLRRKNSK